MRYQAAISAEIRLRDISTSGSELMLAGSCSGPMWADTWAVAYCIVVALHFSGLEDLYCYSHKG